MKKLSLDKTFKFDFSNIKRNAAFLVFAILIALGVLLGVLSYTNFAPVQSEAKELFSAHYLLHNNVSFFKLAGQTLLNIIPIAFLAFVIGTSAVGCVLIPVLPLLLGFLFGIISAFIYDTQEIMGVVYNLLILLPPSLVAFFGLLLCCRESFGFSKLLAIMCVKGGKCFNLYLDFKNYSIRYLIILIFFIVYALVDASLTLLFIRFFKF